MTTNDHKVLLVPMLLGSKHGARRAVRTACCLKNFSCPGSSRPLRPQTGDGLSGVRVFQNVVGGKERRRLVLGAKKKSNREGMKIVSLGPCFGSAGVRPVL